MDRKLIGRCGKFCGECEIYMASQGTRDPAEVATALGVPAEKVVCAGCQALTPACYAYGCKIISCLEERGYRYCIQCADINDCTKYARLNAEYGGRPRIYASQLRAWGEERWLRYRSGRQEEEKKGG